MKGIIKLFIIILAAFSLTACWDSIGLERLLLVYGLGVDISKENPENYLFTIGFPTIIEEASEKKMQLSVEAPSFGGGKCNLQQKAYRRISYDNIKMVVFGEDAAKRGIQLHVDSMYREPLFRGSTRFIVVEGRAVDLLSLNPPAALIVSNFLHESIQQNYESTKIPITTLRSFSHEYYTDGIEPVMPFIQYGANRQELNLDSVALFNKDRLVYKLHKRESIAFMILRNEIHQGIYPFDYKSKDQNKREFIAINIKGGNSKIKVKLEDTKLHIDHNIHIHCSLGEYTPEERVFTKEKLEQLQDYIAKEIEADLNRTLKILQKDLKNDNIGYGKHVKAQYPEYFDSENWNEQFSKAIIKINTTVKIKNIGIAQ
ncbi:germination protein, Ger(x)C family [Geosporobacter subterraneus DSM 17957]|uniref:Germination protein, Ger(X)C family n=1 Tax=Geosporobacter subterraneus DSM 17957 TaxID=1121919 RepID=A0A1M6NER8_9FIRM|nr:Ger(x)C family spore germination protein [Geosporobacter subterraneus]SHJ94153.1 germination protein, Ger(x)C family [Geosporobacter subterraneus DSM 17957]